MFSRIFALTALAMPILAAATPAPADKRWGSPPPPTTAPAPPVTVTVTATAPGSTTTVPAGSCNTGSIQCCNSVESVSGQFFLRVL